MAKEKIADISTYQDDVDWQKAAQELSFCILRASIGQKADSKYLRNVDGCIQHNVPFGAYHYVKAGTAEDAKAEARFFVQTTAAAATKPLFYIADIEYKAQDSATTEPVCVAFLEELRALGCSKIGLYINTRYKWAGAAIPMCDIMWIPHWGKNDGSIPAPQYEPKNPCDLWQYTSKGTLAGVKGDVDLSACYGGRDVSFFTEGWNPERGVSTMFTNLQFAAYCLAVFAAKWVYWYGTCGYECTISLYNRKKERYSKYYTDARASGYKADIANGCMCADCVGLIKSFFWKGGDLNGKNVYQANNCPDRSADGMFSLCVEKGAISTIPDIPGLLVHKSGHIGVYVGGGYTVEMKGFAYDCVKQKVTDGPWTEWGKLPDTMLAYLTEGEVEQPVAFKLGDRVLSKGSAGEDVSELQAHLVALGYNIGASGPAKNGVDGDFGSKTQAAVKALQKSAGLDQTGVFDANTHKALLDALTPSPGDDQNDDTPEGGGAPAYVLILEGDEKTLRLVQSAYGGTLAAVDSVTVG